MSSAPDPWDQSITDFAGSEPYLHIFVAGENIYVVYYVIPNIIKFLKYWGFYWIFLTFDKIGSSRTSVTQK